jgi:hypothetical protein
MGRYVSNGFNFEPECEPAVIFVLFLNLVGDGYTYFERGCAVHGEVSRREGRNCIERVGQ